MYEKNMKEIRESGLRLRNKREQGCLNISKEG